MSEQSARAALRSDAQLVLVESPAGCGKTHQGAEYAREFVTRPADGRTLILAHTHAACSVFSNRTKGAAVDVRTIDSLLGQVASAYHRGLDLPHDIPRWLRQNSKTGHSDLAIRVSHLLRANPIVAQAIARRYPTVICDEHQDASGAQHAAIVSLLENGARVRIFADPMQAIYRDTSADARSSWNWESFTSNANSFEELNVPHRWARGGCPDLGQWTLKARKLLKSGQPIDLKGGLPASVKVVAAENSAKQHMHFQLRPSDRTAVDHFVRRQSSLLVLTPFNATAKSLRPFFNRRILLWEGHTRSALEQLVLSMESGRGNPTALADAVVSFMGQVGVGFSRSAFGKPLLQEAAERCARKRRGKPALIQELASCVVDEPNHQGVSRLLKRLLELRASEDAFSTVQIDSFLEYSEAVRLARFDSPSDGLSELTHRRTFTRPSPPARAISTIHKAKGLECENVVVMPCDAKTFPDRTNARCLLYVALSRATRGLMLVVSRANPSPLLAL